MSGVAAPAPSYTNAGLPGVHRPLEPSGSRRRISSRLDPAGPAERPATTIAGIVRDGHDHHPTPVEEC